MEESSIPAQEEAGGTTCEEVSPVPVLAGMSGNEVSAGDQSVVIETFSELGKPQQSPVKAGILAEPAPGLFSSHSTIVQDVVVDPLEVSPDKPPQGLESRSQEAGPNSLPATCDDVVKDVEGCSQLFKILVLRTAVDCDFRMLCREASTFVPSVLQLGISALQLLLMTPRDGKWIEQWLKACLQENTTSPNRGIFPMCLPPVGAAVQLLKRLPKTSTGLIKAEISGSSLKHTNKRQQSKKLVEEGCKQLWRMIIVGVLTGSSCWWKLPTFSLKNPPSAAQKSALNNIDKWVQHFCHSPLAQVKLPSFGELAAQRGVDYSGEEISHALPLKLGELRPGLPVKGVAGSLCAAGVSAPEVRAWVCDPGLALKDEKDWPQQVPKASINATRDDWYDICCELVKLNILEPIPYEEIFRAHGKVVLNGAFAVLKKGTPAPGESRVTRLIMNLIPSNSYQRLMAGDLGTLSSSTNWCNIVLKPDQCLLWSSEDQKGAFYAWKLPKGWRRFMAFRWPIPGERLGLGNHPIYLSASVIPMGWLNAVSLFQHLHRRLGLCAPPSGAGFEESLEWRRDRCSPLDSEGKTLSFVQYYLDDFDAPSIVPSDGWEKHCGKLTRLHERQREAYERAGVGIAKDKTQTSEPVVCRMGAEIDGVEGLIGVPREKRVENAYFTLWLLGQGYHPTRVRLMVLGRWVRCFEFRRPLMNLLQSSWPKHDPRVRSLLTYENRQELLECICLCPLAGTDLRARVDGMVTCSDASETGGGLCASGQLTEEGLALLSHLRSTEFAATRLIPFSPLGAMQMASDRGPRVFVVSLFDGISALMCALCRMEVQIIGFASSEVDKECKKLVRRRWPGVIELNDITKISTDMLEALASSTGYKVDFVLAGGGSPCQDLSALLSGGKGLAGERSKLFYCMPKIFDGLKKAFSCPVYTFVENVFSMTPHNRSEFSRTLDLTPVMLDSKYVSWCRRPRLFWCNWDIIPRGQEVLLEQDGYREWQLPGLQPPSSSWLDPLCVQREGGLMPTLTRALPRKTPPREPAGIHTASPEAISRWRSDQHRFQVYQYESYLCCWTSFSQAWVTTTNHGNLVAYFSRLVKLLLVGVPSQISPPVVFLIKMLLIWFMNICVKPIKGVLMSVSIWVFLSVLKHGLDLV